MALLSLQLTSADAAIKQRDVTIQTKAAGSLTGRLYAPDQADAVPGVLVLHTAGGLRDADHLHARTLAEAGFAALVVSYPIGWVASVNEGLAEAATWLRAQKESLQMPIGVMGFSLGASKALLVAALRPQFIKAVVSYYGTYNADISKFKAAAQKARAASMQATPSPVQVAGRLSAAVLLLQGENDDETPPDQTAQMKAALEKGKKTFELVIYPGAVHMFEREPKYHPPGNRTSFGTVTGYDAAAAKDSWEKSVAWLNRYLRSEAK